MGHRSAVKAWCAAAALGAVCVGVFWPLTHAGYFAVDDDLYASGNRHVQAGLTAAGAAWAFTSVGYAANWHPLTWLSLMLDVTVFGPGPRGHHIVNVLLHAANAALVLLVVRSFSGALLPGALVAALFALHPLRVESVAWIAERKDVLCAFFGLLAVAAHLWHARRPSPVRFLAILSCFALGLMAKPMLVTLPLLLLVLDWWPLGRFRCLGPPAEHGACARAATPVLIEKIPLLVLSALGAALTLVAQSRGGLVAPAAAVPLAYRVANAGTAILAYLGSALWPLHLGFWYPHPGRGVSPWSVTLAATLIAILSAAALAVARRRPALLAGWLWYLIGIAPVIGIVQVGAQARADRYTYLPLLGPAIFLVVSATEIIRRRGLTPAAARVAVTIALLTLTGLAREQTKYWRDSETVFRRALEVTEDNWVMRNNLGKLLLERGEHPEAATHLSEAVRLKPGYPEPRFNLALALTGLGRYDEAAAAYREVLRLQPGRADALYNLGGVLAAQGRLDEAEASLRAALRVGRDNDRAHNNLAVILLRQGRTEEAIAHLREAVRLNPENAEARNNLAYLQANPP